jgi:hypothetical protein
VQKDKTCKFKPFEREKLLSKTAQSSRGLSVCLLADE